MSGAGGQAWLSCALSCALLVWGATAQAVTPEAWKDTTYSYRASASDATSLGDVLFAFGKSMGLKVKLTPDVTIRQKALIDGAAATPAVFLDKLTTLHGLSWFVHEGVLHIANAGQNKIEKIPLGNLSPAVAKQALQGLGV